MDRNEPPVHGGVGPGKAAGAFGTTAGRAASPFAAGVSGRKRLPRRPRPATPAVFLTRGFLGNGLPAAARGQAVTSPQANVRGGDSAHHPGRAGGWVRSREGR